MSTTCGETSWSVACVNDVPEFALVSTNDTVNQSGKIIFRPGMQFLHPDTKEVLYTCPSGPVKKGHIKIPAE